MLNIMIVEDEVLVRTGLRTLISWEKNGFCLLAEATNGEEALQILLREDIDILITDIRMPKMDGLTLIKKIREKGYKCEVVVLSSYDEFDYVKRAMVLGVKDYIHKPTMMPEEIVETLKRVEEDILKKHLAESYQKIIGQTIDETKAFLLEKTIKQIIENGSNTFPAEQFCSDIDLSKRKYHIFMIKLLHKVKSSSEEISKLKAEKSLREIFETLKNNSGCAFKKDGYWISLWENEVPPMLYADINTLSKTLEDMDIIYLSSESLHTLDEMPEGLRWMKGEIDKIYNTKNWMTGLSSSVAFVVTYINENYSTELSLEDLANKIHINSSYLSRVFLKEIGQSYIDYLTEIRINHAKSLLKETHFTIAKVAEKVGYSNEKYFMKLFKKYTGETPGGFRNSNKVIPLR